MSDTVRRMLNGHIPGQWTADTRPTDDEMLALIRDRIAGVAPAVVRQCEIRDGLMVGLPAWSVMMLPNHTKSPGHFDIGFNPDLEAGQSGVVTDCISGLGTLREAVGQVLRIWLETSGACFLETLTMDGRFADHVVGSQPDGLPGWQAVASPITGYSYGADTASALALRDAMGRNAVLSRLSGHLLPLLTKPVNNGIKFFYFKKADSAIAEVRVNGVANPEASQALADLDWPEVTDPAIVRYYAVATRPSGRPAR